MLEGELEEELTSLGVSLVALGVALDETPGGALGGALGAEAVRALGVLGCVIRFDSCDSDARRLESGELALDDMRIDVTGVFSDEDNAVDLSLSRFIKYLNII